MAQDDLTLLAAVRDALAAQAEGRDAEGAMDRLVGATSLRSPTRLDALERTIREELQRIERTPRPGSWQAWKPWQTRERTASWLDLCSGNGFLRENALRCIEGPPPNSLFWALALRRLNDWVPQVRAAARARLPELAERSVSDHVAEALWHTLRHWDTWGRLEESDRCVLLELLSLDGVARGVKSRILTATAGSAVRVLVQAGRSSAFDQWHSEFAHSAIQPAVRARAFRSLFEGRLVWTTGTRWTWTNRQWCKGRYEPVLEGRPLSGADDCMKLLETAALDTSTQVRRVAGEFTIKRLGELGVRAVGVAERLAGDPNPSVALRGRFALGLLGRP